MCVTKPRNRLKYTPFPQSSWNMHVDLPVLHRENRNCGYIVTWKDTIRYRGVGLTFFRAGLGLPSLVGRSWRQTTQHSYPDIHNSKFLNPTIFEWSDRIQKQCQNIKIWRQIIDNSTCGENKLWFEIFFQAPKIWNMLPADTRNSECLPTFKKALKQSKIPITII